MWRLPRDWSKINEHKGLTIILEQIETGSSIRINILELIDEFDLKTNLQTHYISQK